MSDKPIRIGDRVRIDGGRWDGNTGRVVMIRTPEDILFSKAGPEGFVGSAFMHDNVGEPIDMALVEFPQPLEMVGGKLDSVGVPVRRLKAI